MQAGVDQILRNCITAWDGNPDERDDVDDHADYSDSEDPHRRYGNSAAYSRERIELSEAFRVQYVALGMGCRLNR